jgi:sulfonate transport system ATP-binding protein
MEMAGIELVTIKKSYVVEEKTVPVLSGISLTLPEESITVILGKSGCGKTTLLRLVGGLEQPDGGEIIYGSSHRTAYVFQEPRLMPWLTVTDNICFGLKKKERNPAEIAAIIRTVGLEGFEKAYPYQLSGGMQQRAAIARALAYKPSFIMMDEPFAALDYFTREQMQRELLRVQRSERASILFVTHSIDEALLLGHKIVIIENGLVKAQFELPKTEEPRNLLDAQYIDLKRDIIGNLDDK